MEAKSDSDFKFLDFALLLFILLLLLLYITLNLSLYPLKDFFNPPLTKIKRLSKLFSS